LTTANDVLSALQSAFPGAVEEAKVSPERQLWATIKPDRIVDVCKYLRDNHNFDHYSGAAGVDRIDEGLFGEDL
jgi:NADH:ubiquinone oxidoreductase subunit C